MWYNTNMDEKTQDLNTKTEDTSPVGVVHILLFHSYVIFLVAIVLGIIVDVFFHIDLFRNNIYQYFGFLMIIIGSILIYWAQNTTSYPKSDLGKERDTNFFIRGPYRYTRNPTNLGITLMSLGLAFILNSFFSIVFVVIAYLISKLFFIRKQDTILAKRYGKIFDDYKEKVRDWL